MIFTCNIRFWPKLSNQVSFDKWRNIFFPCSYLKWKEYKENEWHVLLFFVEVYLWFKSNNLKLACSWLVSIYVVALAMCVRLLFMLNFSFSSLCTWITFCYIGKWLTLCRLTFRSYLWHESDGDCDLYENLNLNQMVNIQRMWWKNESTRKVLYLILLVLFQEWESTILVVWNSYPKK